MSSMTLSPEKLAEVQALAQAIRAATDAEIDELARHLLTTDDQHLFGQNEFTIRGKSGGKSGVRSFIRQTAAHHCPVLVAALPPDSRTHPQ